MIIDCHGHCTTAPKALETWRNQQIKSLAYATLMPKVSDLKSATTQLPWWLPHGPDRSGAAGGRAAV